VRLLRPAESAARRLIIAAARGIVVVLPPLRPRKPKPKLADTVSAMQLSAYSPIQSHLLLI
jgi:hypothetical protein